jgi:hypothetical protein
LAIFGLVALIANPRSHLRNPQVLNQPLRLWCGTESEQLVMVEQLIAIRGALNSWICTACLLRWAMRTVIVFHFERLGDVLFMTR